VNELEPWKWLTRRTDRQRTRAVVVHPTRLGALLLACRKFDVGLELVDARVLREGEGQ